MEEKAYLGCLPAKIDLRDYKLCSANIEAEYPEDFLLDNLPRVKNQGRINSCAAHATSSILEYYADNKFNLSTNFIYGIQKKECGQTQMGMYLKDCLTIATKFGDMVEDDCPGNEEVPKCWSIAEETLNNQRKVKSAYRFRINSYYLCNSDNDIKFALMNYGPVLGAVYWRDAYVLNSSGIITFDNKSNGGGHAIMIIGWDETGWIIQNSWGESFGINGCFVLPYEYGLLEARAVIDEENDNELNGLVLMKPERGFFKDIYYKVANFFLNLFKKII